MYLKVLDKNKQKIFFNLKKFEGFYLAGGTALALQLGHRVSADFDLFSAREISPTLLLKVKSVFINKKIVPAVNNRDELTVFIGGIKVSFIKYPFPVLEALIDYQGIKLLTPKEIAVTKAYSIGRRGTYKDYIDLYFVLAKKYCSLDNIIKLAEKKYGAEFNSRLFLEQLVYLEDVKDIDIIFLRNKITKNRLQNFFNQEIKKLKLR